MHCNVAPFSNVKSFEHSPARKGRADFFEPARCCMPETYTVLKNRKFFCTSEIDFALTKIYAMTTPVCKSVVHHLAKTRKSVPAKYVKSLSTAAAREAAVGNMFGVHLDAGWGSEMNTRFCGAIEFMSASPRVVLSCCSILLVRLRPMIVCTFLFPCLSSPFLFLLCHRPCCRSSGSNLLFPVLFLEDSMLADTSDLGLWQLTGSASVWLIPWLYWPLNFPPWERSPYVWLSANFGLSYSDAMR